MSHAQLLANRERSPVGPCKCALGEEGRVGVQALKRFVRHQHLVMPNIHCSQTQASGCHTENGFYLN